MCIWNDLVVKVDQAAAAGSGGNGDDRSVEELQADAEAAEFAMVKSKLAIFGVQSVMDFFVYIVRLYFGYIVRIFHFYI